MSQTIGVLLALAAIVALPGCQNAKDMQIIELQRQVDDLSAANADLESQLSSAMSGGDRASRTALTLQSQLDEARRRADAAQRQADDLMRQLAAANAAGGSQQVSDNAPPGWSQTSGFTWTDVGTDILFDSGKAKLKRGAEQAIADVVATIKSQWPGKNIFIIGYTDSDPIKRTKHLWKDNLDLSVNRAMSVAHEFYKLGVDPNLVYAAGQGEHNSKAPNDSKANKKLNRRVLIAVVR